MYTIGQVSETFDLQVSTLRYYDREGLFSHLERTSGIRQFSSNELEALRVVECLKKSGAEIKDIRQFMQWCAEGSRTHTYGKRRKFFLQQKKSAEEEMEKMKRTLDMIRFKCWYYEQAMKEGSEDRIRKMLPDWLPEDIQRLYDHAHEKQAAADRLQYLQRTGRT